MWGIKAKGDSLGNLAWSVRASRDSGRRNRTAGELIVVESEVIPKAAARYDRA